MAQPPKKELWFRCGRYFLRTVKREDASDRWASWLSDPWTVHVLNTAPRAFTKSDVIDYIKRFDQRSRLLLGIFEMGTRLHVGFVRIDLDAAGDALVNAVIGEAAHRNRGANTDVFVALLDFLFDRLAVKRARLRAGAESAHAGLSAQARLAKGRHAGRAGEIGDGWLAARDLHGEMDARGLQGLSANADRQPHPSASVVSRKRTGAQAGQRQTIVEQIRPAQSAGPGSAAQ
jgi:Acetyltransferase (GNAT) domain